MSRELPVHHSKEILGGTPVFSGTRVPAQTLIDYLEAGDSINDFLDDFPTVKKNQVIQFLEKIKITLLTKHAHIA